MALCKDITEDGLSCGVDWPNCKWSLECVEQGCFWRRCHTIAPDQMRAREPPKFKSLLYQHMGAPESDRGASSAKDD